MLFYLKSNIQVIGLAAIGVHAEWTKFLSTHASECPLPLIPHEDPPMQIGECRRRRQISSVEQAEVHTHNPEYNPFLF